MVEFIQAVNQLTWPGAIVMVASIAGTVAVIYFWTK